MSANEDDHHHEHPPTPEVRPLGPPAAIPVYNCQVYVSPPDGGGLVQARAAGLDDLTGTGKNEREALQAVVTQFKALATRCQTDGTAIPWLAQPHAPRPEEQPRWIAVHL